MKLGRLVQRDEAGNVGGAENVPAVSAVVFADEKVEGGAALGRVARYGGFIRLKGC